jgi:hypothetical protein
VDGNVLLDIATIDPNWSDWSGMALAACAEHTTLIEALDGKPASPGGAALIQSCGQRRDPSASAAPVQQEAHAAIGYLAVDRSTEMSYP